MATVSLRLDDELTNKVKELAEQSGQNPTDLYRSYIEAGLAGKSNLPVPAGTLELSGAVAAELEDMRNMTQNQFVVFMNELLICKSALRAIVQSRGPEQWQKVLDAAKTELDDFLSPT